MSKKIWRGTEYAGNTVRQKEHPRDQAYNCTVVPDSTCFPINEAMALCKAASAWVESDPEDADYVVDCQIKLNQASDKYLRAAERMKKKASKK